jgi:hypothetical protein
MCSVNPAMVGRPLKQLRGIGGAVIGDLRMANKPAINPVQRTMENASPAGPQTQYSPSTGVTQVSPLANAMTGVAVAQNTPSAFANGPIKMNNSANKTGRVIS